MTAGWRSEVCQSMRVQYYKAHSCGSVVLEEGEHLQVGDGRDLAGGGRVGASHLCDCIMHYNCGQYSTVSPEISLQALLYTIVEYILTLLYASY